jgi:hypothetical protein
MVVDLVEEGCNPDMVVDLVVEGCSPDMLVDLELYINSNYNEDKP